MYLAFLLTILTAFFGQMPALGDEASEIISQFPYDCPRPLNAPFPGTI